MKGYKFLLFVLFFVLYLSFVQAVEDPATIEQKSCFSFDAANVSGTTVFDTGKSLNNGTIANTVTINGSDCALSTGECANFSNEAVHANRIDTIKNADIIGGTSRTYMYWVKYFGPNSNTNGFAFSQGQVASEGNGWGQSVRGDTHIVQFTGGGGCDQQITTLDAPEEWTHFAWIYNDSSDTVTLYLNATKNITITSCVLVSQDVPIKMGNTNNNDDGGQILLDEFKIWNGTLSQINASNDYNDGAGVPCTAIIPPDTTPPEIDLINLTSEGGDGYIVFNRSDEELGKLSGRAKTNDTEPTVFVLTDTLATCAIIDNDRDLNHTDIFTGNANFDTEGLAHTLTLNLTNKTGIGLHNFSIGCKDALGNENSTSTSGKFTINITSAAGSTLILDTDRTFFVVDINNTDIVINGTSTSIDGNYTITIDHNATQIYFNNSFLNNTEFKVVISNGTGTHVFNITATDSFNTINLTGFTITIENDSVSPIAQLNDSGGFFVNDVNNSFTITFNATDNINLTYTIEAFINGSSEFLDTAYNNGSEVALNLTRGVGNFNFTVIATDPYQNTGSATFSFEVQNDSTAPVIILIFPNNNSYGLADFNASLQYNFSATDDFNDTFTVLGIRNGTTLFDSTTYINNTNGNLNVTGEIGTFRWNVTATDLYGNTGTKFFDYEVRNDTDAPSLTIHTIADNVFFKLKVNNTILFNATCDDNINVTYTAQFYVDSVLEFENTTYTNGTNFNFTLEVGLGSHIWNATCIDPYNNLVTEERSFDVVEADINFTLNGPTNETLIYSETNIQFNFTFNFTENIDTCYLSINGSINRTNESLITSNQLFTINGTNLTINSDFLWSVGCNTTEGAERNASDSFLLFVYDPVNVSFSPPTVKNGSTINNFSILINVSTRGRILNFTLEFNGTNESITFNNTLNLLINKTGLDDLTTYTFRVYVNDSNGNINQTEERTIFTNLFGLEVSVTTGVNLQFIPTIENEKAFFGNQSLVWAGNNTAISLTKSRVSGNFTLYNNGTIVNQNGNYTVDLTNGRITITNQSTIWNGTGSNIHTPNQILTLELKFSYNYFTNVPFLKTINISCDGQNQSLGCLNFSTSLATDALNLSLLFNITNDPVRPLIIEDFSIDDKNWTVLQQRSNNTNNRSQANHSILCIEIQSVNQTGLIQYRFNNTLELDYLNGSNESTRLNFSFSCPKTNAVFRILNGSQKNISGFDFFNFTWLGDNTTNTFSVNLIDEAGTKVSSPTLSLANVEYNFSGFSLGSLANISIINISITNATGTVGTSSFRIDTMTLTNSTHNQSQYLTMYASCTGNFGNATTLIPNVWTQICILNSGLATKFVHLFQDIIAPFKGLEWFLDYNVTKIT